MDNGTGLIDCGIGLIVRGYTPELIPNVEPPWNPPPLPPKRYALLGGIKWGGNVGGTSEYTRANKSLTNLDVTENSSKSSWPSLSISQRSLYLLEKSISWNIYIVFFKNK